MFLSFLNAAQKSDVEIGTGALYALVGFVIVLAVLALLVGIFTVSGLVFRTKVMSREKLFEKQPKNHDPEFIPTAVPEISEDDEVVAAITAAISVILSEEGRDDEKHEFVIRKIVRNK